MKRNNEIQYLRGCAALMVVLDHAMLRLAKSDINYSWLEPLAGDFGAIGVQIFFVISGYIMVAISYDAEGQPISPWRFWKARAERIAPLYWIATFIAILLAVWMGHPSIDFWNVATSLAFVPWDAQPNDPGLVPILGVGWTLNYEMFFYLIFGLGLFLPRRWGLLWSVGAVFGLVILGQVLSRLELWSSPKDLIAFYTREIMLLFASGMILAAVERSVWFKLLPARVPMPALIGGLVAVGLTIGLNVVAPNQYPLWRTLLSFGVATCAVALCVLAAPQVGRNNSPPARIAEFVGDGSYSLYLFHGFGLTAAIGIWRAIFGTGFPIGQVVFTFLAALAVGLLAYVVIERPLLSLIYRRKASRSAALALNKQAAP